MSMRSTWRGNLGVGLLNIGVKLYKAQDSADMDLHLVHAECGGGRINYMNKCNKCQAIVARNELKRGYEIGDKLVILDENDMASLPLKSARSVEIVGFTKDKPSVIMQESVYYAAPDKGGEKAFALLSKVMANLGVAAIGKVAMRNREHLVSISPFDGVMLVQSLCWADEVRGTEEIRCKDVMLSPREIELATKLVESMVTQIDLSTIKDEYREALEALVEAKINGTILEYPKDLVGVGTDLLKSLEASLAGVK